MKTPDEPAADPAHAPEEAEARARKRYEKPQFAREQLFETMALACGKAHPSVGQCKQIKKSS